MALSAPGKASGESWQQLTDTSFVTLFDAASHGPNLSCMFIRVTGGIVAVRVTPLHSADTVGGSDTSVVLGDDGSGNAQDDEFPFVCKRGLRGELSKIEVKKISGSPYLWWTPIRQ